MKKVTIVYTKKEIIGMVDECFQSGMVKNWAAALAGGTYPGSFALGISVPPLVLCPNLHGSATVFSIVLWVWTVQSCFLLCVEV